MNTTVRFFLSGIGLLSMVNHVHGEAARDDVGVVLEVGEVATSTVKVEALVVYEREEPPQPLGAWARLDTAKGYIKAVGQRRLIVGLEPDGRSKGVILDRIQRLVLVGSSSPGVMGAVVRDSRQPDSGRVKGRSQEMLDRIAESSYTRVGKRLYVKGRAGVIGGLSFAVVGLLLGHAIGDDYCSNGGMLYFCIPDDAALGTVIGYGVGTAGGVSIVDPHDRFVYSLAGSLFGILAGVALDNGGIGLVFPLPMAILASELSRNPPETRHISVNLVPHSTGHLSAVAKLRF